MPKVGKLYIVATPIGNLADINFRALEALKNVDSIICEDTRVTRKLLDKYQISQKLSPFNDFNESDRVEGIIEQLKKGQDLALVSDAGSPLISDPGYKLIRACYQSNIQVEAIPGAAAPIAALQVSGLPTDRFYFAGFPPKKGGKRNEYFDRLRIVLNQLEATTIAFESPSRLNQFLEELKTISEDLYIAVVREQTKSHEEIVRGKLVEVATHFQNKLPKGEVTLVISTKN